MKKRTLVDIGMVMINPLLMAYSMIGETLHEFIGIAMFALFISHHIINRKWLTSLRKGTWNAVRGLNTALDIVLFIFMLIMMISAPTISRTVFAFLNLGGAAIGRTVHLVGANWLFILMSLHLGLHIGAVSASLGISKNKKLCRILSIIFILIAVYGCYALIKRNILSYMFFRQMFAAFDLSEPVILFILDYLTIMDLFAVIGFYLNRVLVYFGNKHRMRSDGKVSEADKKESKAAKQKKRRIILGAIGAVILIAVIVWGIPYYRRHFITATVNRKEATSLNKVELQGKTLIVQFTRTGNSDFDDDVDAVSSASLMLDEEGKLVGNAELLAEMVQSSTGGDIYAIRVRDLYPSTYSGTVSVAGKELRSSGFPALKTDIPYPEINDYSRVILVFPLWWGTVPKAVEGFLSEIDLSDLDVYLILTHGGGGTGSVPDDLPKMIRGGRLNDNILLIYDDDADTASDKVYEWIRTLN